MTNATDQTDDGHITLPNDADGWIAVDDDGVVWAAAADSQRATLNATARKYGDDADVDGARFDVIPAVDEVLDAFRYGSADYGDRGIIVDDGIAVAFPDDIRDGHTFDDDRRRDVRGFRFPTADAADTAVAAIRGRGDLGDHVRIDRYDGDTIVVEAVSSLIATRAGSVAEFYGADPIESGVARSGDDRVGGFPHFVEPGDRVAADGRIGTLQGTIPAGAVGTVERIALKGDASGDPVPYLRVRFDDGTTDVIRADAFRPVGRPAY